MCMGRRWDYPLSWTLAADWRSTFRLYITKSSPRSIVGSNMSRCTQSPNKSASGSFCCKLLPLGGSNFRLLAVLVSMASRSPIVDVSVLVGWASTKLSFALSWLIHPLLVSTSAVTTQLLSFILHDAGTKYRFLDIPSVSHLLNY
jgi:hypothetical protein